MPNFYKMMGAIKNTFFNLKTCLAIALFFSFFSIGELWGQTVSQTFNADDTFTVPPGVTSITVEAWGAGGGGSNRNGSAGGGGGGAYTRGVLTGLIPGSIITVTVGNGGTPGNNGGQSIINTIIANGGSSTNSRVGGTGGAASAIGGDVVASFSGGNGGTAPTNGGGGDNENGGGGGGSAYTTANGSNGTGGQNSNSVASPGGAGTGTGGQGAARDGNPNATEGSEPGAGGGGRGEGGGTSKNGADGRVIITYTPVYRAQFTAMDIGSNVWFAGETRTVTVTVVNTGAVAWTDANPDINIGVKWNADPDYLVRVDAGNVAPGDSRTYSLTITAPTTTGSNNLTFDAVCEGYCWFATNSSSCGFGNTVYTSSPITITQPPALGSAYANSGTYTVPPGVTSLKVEAWGGGGGGSSIDNGLSIRGGGGGGGAYSKSIVTVIPGNTYNVVVGSGGLPGTAGTASSFGGTLVVAAGGSGAVNNSSTGGAGATLAASTGTTEYAGGSGANGGGTNSGGGGGGAGSNGAGGSAVNATAGTGTSLYGGNGGTGVSGSNNGQAGLIFGGGGSGAVTNSATGRTGGSGSSGLVIINLPSQVSISSPAQVTASDVNQGTIKLPISAFQTAITISDASLTQLSFTTAGTYVTTDVTRFQLWYNTTNNFAGATQLGSDINTSLGAGSHAFTFSRVINAGTTGYFWITADVSATATSNATLSVNALAPADFTFELASVSGSATAGGTQTFIPVPRVVLASATPAVPTANVNQGTKNHPVYSFNTAITWADATLNSVTFTTGGNYAATDVLNFKLWYNTSNDLATASQLGSPIIGTLGTGSHTFSGLNLVTTTGSTGYFWITTDIAPFPNNGRTINVSAITTADLNYASIVFKSGAASAGNAQTIVTQNGVFITSTYPAVSANSILQGSLKQNVYKFSTIVSGAAVTLNSVSFTTSGTYVASDILNFKLHYNTINSMVGATELATLTTGLGAGNHTFTGLSQSTNASTTGYFWITADVASGAVPAHTLIVDPITTGSLVYSGTPNKFSTTYAGGIQTIQLKIDSDNDGVADLYDLDDDNDGIPDIDENQSCNMAVAELFPNSNFDAGNTGFTSGYEYVTIVNQTSLHPEGIYAITPNANSGHGSFANCTGHGNMMVVNGSPNPNLIVWSSGTIAVTPNTDYTLSINLTSVNPANPAQLIFNVNGENIGLQFNATTTNCQWVPGVAIWNSGSNTSATFDIMNLNLIAGGNDFAIDDVSCKYKINCDYDGDGVPDKLDLDSDNDGIYDVVEAGGTATATGTINGFTDTDQDGLSDNVDNKDAGTGGPINVFNGTPLANPDTDTDGIPNRADTDSDNDFCPDTKEAGLPDPDGDGRLGSLPLTYDTRGIVTSAVGYTGTIDTNSDGIKDYVQRIPYITTQPTNKTLCLPTAGTTFSITATNTGGTYQWQVSTDNGVTWSNLTNGGVYSGTSGAGVGALTINNTVTTAYNNYKYKILLTNTAYNCSPLESDVVSLYIYSGAPAVPGIISGNTTVCSSVNQNYSIALVPSATSYTWTVPAGWSIVSGQTTNAITASTGAGGGNIQVTATNFCGTSAPRTLAVNISAPTPTLTTPAATVCQSADVVYTTETGKTNYVWTVGGAVGVDYVIKAGGTSTDNTLTLNWLKTGSKNVTVNYTSGGCPGLTPASVTVTVNPNAMVLTQPITPAPVCAGAETVTLSITASGASGYQWQVSTDGGSNWNNLSNAGFYSNVTTATLTITNPPVSYNNYQYRCVITGSCGNANSYSVTLTVNDIQPATANAGSAATCSQITANWTASSNATKYFLDVSTVNTFASFVTGYSNLDVGNVTTYNVTGLSAGTTYYYRVRAYNTCGSSASSAIITYATSPTTSISSQSTDTQTKCNGDAFAAMSVTAAGMGTLTYQWYSNTSSSNSGGTLITGATSASYTPLSTTDGTLYYYCIVTGGCGSVTSSISGAIIVTHRPNTGDLYRKPNN